MDWFEALTQLVEKQSHKKFKRRPQLVWSFVGPPASGEHVIDVPSLTNRRKLRLDYVTVPLTLLSDTRLLNVATTHELVENLNFQHGKTPAQSHRVAVRSEATFRRQLGIKGTTGKLMREFFDGRRLLL